MVIVSIAHNIHLSIQCGCSIPQNQHNSVHYFMPFGLWFKKKKKSSHSIHTCNYTLERFYI